MSNIKSKANNSNACFENRASIAKALLPNVAIIPPTKAPKLIKP